MIGRILVALDGTPPAEAILPHVAKIAAKGTHVTLLLVTHSPQPIKHNTVVDTGIRHVEGGMGGLVVLPDRQVLRTGEDRTQAIEALEDEGMKYLAAVGKSFADDGIQTECHAIIADDIAQAIADYASANAMDLIAMTTHAREGLSRLVSGSVSGKILELAPMPVLLVRAHSP